MSANDDKTLAPIDQASNMSKDSSWIGGPVQDPNGYQVLFAYLMEVYDRQSIGHCPKNISLGHANCPPCVEQVKDQEIARDGWFDNLLCTIDRLRFKTHARTSR